MPKVLIVTPPTDDYASDSLLHGLRELLGENVIDFPRAEHMYRSANQTQRARTYGRGFTLFHRMDEVEIDRDEVWARAHRGEFDLVVFGDISRSWGNFAEWGVALKGVVPIALVDGADSPAFYPYGPKWWRHPSLWSLPRPRHADLLFKREIGPWTYRTSVYGLLPSPIARRVGPMRKLKQFSFSIPSENIVADIPTKTKLFPAHIVDEEIAERVGAATSYAFDDEAAYYADLQSSTFGITTKRAGWDCMRHYEIAANGTIPCFRQLSAKPSTCAPHGLVDGVNCIEYRDGDELMSITESLDANRIRTITEGALEWARQNTTVVRARQFLAECGIPTD